MNTTVRGAGLQPAGHQRGGLLFPVAELRVLLDLAAKLDGGGRLAVDRGDQLRIGLREARNHQARGGTQSGGQALPDRHAAGSWAGGVKRGGSA